MASPTIIGAGAPTVDVLLVTFDVERFVTEAVQGALRQDYRPIRLVVVDDGSSDSTVSLIRHAVLGADVPVTIVALEHSGTSAAFRAGLAACTADWIAVMHGDDISLPHRVSEQMAAITSADVVLVHSEYVAIDEQSRVLPNVDSSLDLPPATGDALQRLVLLEADVRSMTMLFERRRFVNAGGYRTEYRSEDWQSILVLASVGTIAHVQKPLVHRRVRHSSDSSRVNRTRKDFSPGDIGFPLVREVAPQDIPIDYLGALHTGTVLTNAIANLNAARAWRAFRFGFLEFPGGRCQLLIAVVRGLRSIAWRVLKSVLTTSLASRIRRALQRH